LVTFFFQKNKNKIKNSKEKEKAKKRCGLLNVMSHFKYKFKQVFYKKINFPKHDGLALQVGH